MSLQFPSSPTASRFQQSKAPQQFTSPINTPMQAGMPDPMTLIAQLGLKTVVSFDGKVQYNEPLVQSIVNCGTMAFPALKTLFLGTANTGALLEGLYVAGKMADAQVPGMAQLYPSLTRWNSHPDPNIQMHLARFYRKINEPKTFGPMLSTAVNYAVNQYPMISSPAYNVIEEVGKTLLSQLVSLTAQETVRQMIFYQPYMQQMHLNQASRIPQKRSPF